MFSIRFWEIFFNSFTFSWTEAVSHTPSQVHWKWAFCQKRLSMTYVESMLSDAILAWPENGEKRNIEIA